LPRRLDAVVVHSPEIWGLYGTFHSMFRRRCLLIENSDSRIETQRRLAAWLQRVANGRADLYLPWTTYVADQIPRRAGYRGAQINVLPPGVVTDHWLTPSQPREELRRKQLLFVGGDPIRKGLDILLDALERLPDVHLTIATQSRHLPSAMRAR